MKVHYTARNVELAEKDKLKAQRRFEKVHRILSADRNLEAHVVLTRERHHCEAEVTLRALHHTLVVTGTNALPAGALTAAVEKLEKQAVKNKHKLIDSRKQGTRRARRVPIAVEEPTAAAPAAEAPNGGAAPPRIARSSEVYPKPLTAEGAAMQLEEMDSDHITYRDAESGALCVLLRRRDGSLALVEAGG